MAITLIADSGSTKTEWGLLRQRRSRTYFTQGLSPYFLGKEAIAEVLRKELLPHLGSSGAPDEIHFYGTGCAAPGNVRMLKQALGQVFPGAKLEVRTDLVGAARALCGTSRGIVCILGTGSNSGYFNGARITRSSPGLGYVLGDEGSGAYLGRRILQYYLYGTFDEELRARFLAAFPTNPDEVLDKVYRQPLPNRYLASFVPFLAENRGHYMVENILEDGMNDFFFQHLCRYRESWSHPIHFVGGVAHAFQDVLRELGRAYEFDIGRILRAPMEGLLGFHRS